MSSTQHQLIEQCATRLRGIVEALDNIHDTSPHRWSTDLDDVHSSAESLLAMIKDQAPTQAAQGLAGAALARPSPAQAEKAEVERTEGSADLLAIVREAVAGAYNEWKMISEAVTEIMEAHERIVGELRAESAKLSEALDECDGDRWKLRSERDAALARVAELEMLLRKLSTNGLMQFSTVDEEMAVQAALGGAPVSQAQQLHDLDKQCRDDVARALGLRPSQERGFAWSYLLTSIKSCVKASEDSAQAQHSVPEEFIGRLSEFLAQRGTTGKALLRELRAMLAAEPTSSASPSCKWTESSGIWETSCGQTWNFIEDGPAENGALFCHHCGGRLVLIKSDDQEDDGEPCPECLEHGCNGECAGHGAMGD